MESFAQKQKWNSMIKGLAGIVIVLFLLADTSRLFSQSQSIQEVLDRLNNGSVPYIYTAQLSTEQDYIILDAREWNEFNVSRLPGAVYVGFNEFNLDKTMEFLADYYGKVVVYCSIGVRSEKIGNKLLSAGVSNVYNLWGGIFEWKNNGQQVIDANGDYTENVHVFSKKWGEYLYHGVKVYTQ